MTRYIPMVIIALITAFLVLLAHSEKIGRWLRHRRENKQSVGDLLVKFAIEEAAAIQWRNIATDRSVRLREEVRRRQMAEHELMIARSKHQRELEALIISWAQLRHYMITGAENTVLGPIYLVRCWDLDTVDKHIHGLPRRAH